MNLTVSYKFCNPVLLKFKNHNEEHEKFINACEARQIHKEGKLPTNMPSHKTFHNILICLVLCKFCWSNLMFSSALLATLRCKTARGKKKEEN